MAHVFASLWEGVRRTAVMHHTRGNGETDGREQRGIHTFLQRSQEELARGCVADLRAQRCGQLCECEPL